MKFPLVRALPGRLPLLVGSFAAPAWCAEQATGAAGMLQMLPGLGAVLALILALAWLARRMGVARPRAGSHLKLIGERAVGARERVVIVEVAGQWLVLGVAPGQVRTLASMARPEVAEDTPVQPAVATGFAALLERARGKP